MISKELQFQIIKQSILSTSNTELKKYGQHIIVGYRNKKELMRFILEDGIAGVFITTRNIQGKSYEDIQAEIAEFQSIRAQQNLPPLIIATDQEGGIVSRLSPPLPHQPPLATLIESETASLSASQQASILNYGREQGKALKELGITHNFSPVVDLIPQEKFERDKFSRIDQRAISSNPYIVAEVSKLYIQGLNEQGITATLKHFPGLGRTTTDTHLDSATLDTPIKDLMESDFIPFQQLTENTQNMMMLSHVTLTEIDNNHPVSSSPIVIKELIRKQLNIQALLITDDLSMSAVTNSKLGTTKTAEQALDSGVDYLLISYDTDLYYSIMFGLLNKK